jgi:hypothetical protein
MFGLELVPLLDWAAFVLPTLLAIVGVWISIESPRLKSRAHRNAWRVGLITFGIIVSLVTFAQQKVARNETQKQLALNYEPSIALVYYDHRFNIENHGKTDLYLWGDKIADTLPTMDAARIIAPGSSYYLIGEQFEQIALRVVGDNGETRIPFELYLSNKRNEKYVARFELWIVIKEKEITVHTQMLGLNEYVWP